MTKPSSKTKGKKETTPECKAPFSNFSGDIPLEIDPICDSLMEITCGWPKCVAGTLCYFEKETIKTLPDAASLFAWIGSRAPIEWRRGTRAVTKEEFFKRLHQRETWDCATTYPHFPKIEKFLYLTEPPEAKNTGKLDELIARFCPKTDKDRELIKAFVLTLFWGGPAGKRPTFVIAADEDQDEEGGRGTGKTTMVQCIADLVGGCMDLELNGDRDRLTSMLLSPGAGSKRVALIDNLKTSRLSNDLLEKLITRSKHTGHKWYTGFHEQSNYLTFAITVNGAYMGTDMARRVVVIRVTRPPAEWTNWDASTAKFVKANRDAIVADIRWHLEIKTKKKLTTVDTWGPWCHGVLRCCTDKPKALLEHIQEDRKGIDTDKQEISVALQYIRTCIESHLRETGRSSVSVNKAIIWIPSPWLTLSLRSLKLDFTPRHLEQFLARVAGSGGPLKKHDRNTQRGYRWVGNDIDPDDPIKITIRYEPPIPKPLKGAGGGG